MKTYCAGIQCTQKKAIIPIFQDKDQIFSVKTIGENNLYHRKGRSVAVIQKVVQYILQRCGSRMYLARPHTKTGAQV